MTRDAQNNGPARPEADRVLPLAEGQPNTLTGTWPDRACTQVLRPELHSFFAPGAARGRALLCAGGGYLQLVHDKEGVEVAHWLSGLGLDAHVLVHRLPGQADGAGGVWPFDIALQDGLLALQQLARDARLQPALPLLLLGLSSGGHLAGTLACQGAPVQAANARGLLIGYAPLNANHRRYKAPAGKPDYPPPEKQAFYDAWPIGLAAEPHGLPPLPVFISCALHDAVVPVDHTLNLIRSLQQTGGDVEAHIFPQAPHGYALRERTGTHAHWPELAERWLQRVLQA
jgi:alpha-beta hydrolase superfamily lysophospholipase